MMRIGEVAKQCNIGVETVRFYEREGLIPKAQRTASGYRLYPDTIVRHLLFILHAKSLGFSLKEIAELTALKTKPNATCKNIKKKAQMKIDEIQQKIEDLQKMKKALQPLLAKCHSESPVGECPILSVIEEDTLWRKTN